MCYSFLDELCKTKEANCSWCDIHALLVVGLDWYLAMNDELSLNVMLCTTCILEADRTVIRKMVIV